MESQGPMPSFNHTVPDQWELFEQAIFLPPSETGLPPGSQAILLENVENITEQFIPPELDAHADADSNFLDLAEASVENQQRTGKFFLPDGILDKVEASIEQQELKPAVIDEDPPAMENGDVVPQDEVCRTPVGSVWGERFSMPRGRPAYRMHGSMTGLRNGGGLYYYCYLRERSVSTEECDICPNFENSDSTVVDGEEQCRHSVS